MSRQSLLQSDELMEVLSGIRADSIHIIRPHLHRLELPNFLTVYSAVYAHALRTWGLATQVGRAASALIDAQEFSRHPIATELVQLSESALRTEIINNAADELTISTNGIANVFGVTPEEVQSWTDSNYRPLLPLEGHEDVFTLRRLADAYRWRQPEIMGSF